MVDELLPYYDRELSYLRRLAAEFAQAHPEAAGQLRISPDSIEDPHVARLMEATAFLNARIRRKIDDDFPELTDAILGVLYPHYLAPIPSMAIVRFACQDDLTGSFTLPAGTEIETEAVKDETCRFRTCYETELWPIEVAEGKLSGLPLTAYRSDSAVRASRVRASSGPWSSLSVLWASCRMDSARSYRSRSTKSRARPDPSDSRHPPRCRDCSQVPLTRRLLSRRLGSGSRSPWRLHPSPPDSSSPRRHSTPASVPPPPRRP